MSQQAEAASYIAQLDRGQFHDLLMTLDRASLGHSLLRGAAHDLSNASQVFSLNVPGGEQDSLGDNDLSSMSTWVTEKLSNTISMLRDFAVGLREEETPTLMQEVLGTAHRWQQLQRAQPSVPVQLEVEPDLFPVRGSDSRARQLILALIANAKEAMEGQPDGEIRVTAIGEDAGVVVVVEDTGGGIDGAVRKRVFEPFFTTKDRRSHRGLGLTVARATAESWGGSLAVSGGATGGTRVELRLPYWTMRG